MAIGLASTPRCSHAEPVGGAVAHTVVALSLDEGLDEERTVGVKAMPIFG